ncbi:MAG TPA: histidine kinase dimerization/phospho-acceptor domain-containing protein [Roseiarcus sp.]|nr:histidine kinase dimerization/phospho-acceptor domain-containing protein [Roseiarcus sp.]
MTGSHSPELGASQVAVLLAGTPFSAALAAGAPLLVAAVDPPRLVYASDAAKALFGAATLDEIGEAAMKGASPGARRLRDLGRLLPIGAPPRLELLRFFAGRKPLVVGLSCLLLTDSDGAAFLAATAPAPRASGGAPDTPEPAAEIAAASPPAGASDRFLWSVDEAMRFAEPAASLAEALGEAAPRSGETIPALKSRLDLDGDGRLEAALAARATFNNLRLAWPKASGGGQIILILSGAPLFDRERRFLGFRGFGRLTGETVAAAAQTAPPDQPSPSHTAAPRGPAEPVQPPPVAPARLPPQQSAEIVPLRPPPVSGLAAQNVVPIRPDLRAIPPVEEPQPSQSEASIALTPSERSAFREIARALGAKVSDEDAPETEADERADGGAPPDSDAARLLDRLPIGVLVARGDEALYLNRTLLDLLAYDDIEQFRAHSSVSRLFETEDIENLGPAARPVALAAADGQTIAVEGLIQAIEWDGAPATLFSFRRAAAAEIAPRLAALEAEAKARESELAAILNVAADAALALDRDGKILSLNRSGEALFGVEARDVLGEDFAALFTPKERDAARAAFEALRASGLESLADEGREMLALGKDGREIPLFMTMARIGTAAEAKFCAVMRDMTRWKEIERDLEDARRQAEKASALKSEFLAKISHEIRTPLNAIIGFAEVMMEERFGPIGNERYKDYVKDIHGSGGHVMSLVNDLLDLSKIEAGKADLKLAPIDANLIIQECLTLMQPQAAHERVIMRASLAEKLPRVVADERSLRQIMLNLMSNAVKFNEPGGQVIVSTALNDSGQAVIRVRDTGVGMSEGEIATALEPYGRIATDRPAGGAGLGLPLTKALTEANRAQFSIRSGKEQGTLVELAFPTTPAAAAQ